MRRSSAFAVIALGLFCWLAQPAVRADEGQWGTIEGRVVWAGDTIPQPSKIDVNKDQAHCLSKGPLYTEDLVVNAQDKGVRNVFVWLEPMEKNAKMPINPALKEIKNKQVEIDQPCCMFEPHVLAMREGQELLAKNSAPIAHNIHWTGHPLHNPGGNVIVPAGQSYVIKDLKADKYPVKLSCDIHGWMSGWVRIYKNPYFAVTDKDGKFKIKEAPAGEYRLMTWQESVGYLTGRNGQPITIKAGGTTELPDIPLKTS